MQNYEINVNYNYNIKNQLRSKKIDFEFDFCQFHFKVYNGSLTFFHRLYPVKLVLIRWKIFA